MDFKKSTPQPQVPRRAPEEARPVSAAQYYTPSSSKGLALKVIAIAMSLLVVVILVLGVWSMMMGKKSSDGYVGIKANQYQAVFLTNGQVYFGKISGQSDSQVQISNIYYLQVQQKVQPADSKDQSQVSLAKLGEELHGPEDSMFISKQQILFWENLKDNSKVVQAIKNAKR